MMTKTKLYRTFDAKHVNGKWSVVTEGDEIIIASIPTHIKNQKVVALSLSKALSESRFALADLI